MRSRLMFWLATAVRTCMDCSPAVLKLSNDAAIQCDSMIYMSGGSTDDALDGCLCSESKRTKRPADPGSRQDKRCFDLFLAASIANSRS